MKRFEEIEKKKEREERRGRSQKIRYREKKERTSSNAVIGAFLTQFNVRF